MARLHDKVALVTGSARGIGKACAEAFAREGARVVVTDVDEAAGRALADALGSAALWQPLDVREESHWQAAIGDALARFGRLDVLVNNAGITGFDPPTGPHDPEHVSLDAWRAVHATNLDGTLLGCKHAIRAMKPPAGRGGSIINLSSRSGLVGVSGAAAYASSKAAIRNLSKSVALYCAERGYGIRCNSLHPGAILTPMWDAMLGTGPEREANIREYAAEIPVGRMGTAEEVAALAVYLASDDSTYMTGAELVLDGGITAGAPAAVRAK